MVEREIIRQKSFRLDVWLDERSPAVCIEEPLDDGERRWLVSEGVIASESQVGSVGYDMPSSVLKCTDPELAIEVGREVMHALKPFRGKPSMPLEIELLLSEPPVLEA